MRLAIFLALLMPSLAGAQSNIDREAEFAKLAWQKGPTEGRIGDKSTIKVPAGYVFLDARNTSRFLELNGNPPRDGHYMFAPDTFEWWSVFSFEATGFVKDDEKIDPDQLMKSLKEDDGPSNEERKRLGMPAIYTEGWQVPPHYDAQTKRLEWGTRLRSERGSHVVNYTSRLLGRTGVTSAILISNPSTLGVNTEQFKATLQNFSYASGERYAEFKPGDKVAEYGLAALIIGGAAAVATKKGFWAVIVAFLGAFWKIILGVGVALLAGLGKMFSGKKE
jgi:uncharacterized membrane-anchored protein